MENLLLPKLACFRGAVFAILHVHSGESVKLDAIDPDGIIGSDPALFDSEEEAWVYALDRFGDVGGREYTVVDVDDIM
jgi:hypothetical protein